MSDISAAFIIAYNLHFENYELIEKDLGESAGFVKAISDKEYMEADIYVIFDHLMKAGLMQMYVFEDRSKSSSKRKNKKNIFGGNEYQNTKLPVTMKSVDIFENKLKLVDFELSFHLESIKLDKWFLIRWLKMLFMREFH